MFPLKTILIQANYLSNVETECLHLLMWLIKINSNCITADTNLSFPDFRYEYGLVRSAEFLSAVPNSADL